jgi:hypothetical protein
MVEHYDFGVLVEAELEIDLLIRDDRHIYLRVVLRDAYEQHIIDLNCIFI